ncbi:MAG: hypothetical protein ABI402_06925 [Ferruginibacter sp.]
MTYFFILIVVGIIGGLIFLLNKKKKAFFHEASIDADAIILSIHLTGICIKDEIQAVIQLQVLPEMGKSFVSEIKEMLSAIEYTQTQPGIKIRVKYDPRNFKEMVILRESISRTFKTRTVMV